MIGILSDIGLVIVALVIAALVVAFIEDLSPQMNIYMDPFPRPSASDLDRSDTCARMADVMANRFREAGECTSRDLAEAGFSVAEITAFQYDAARMASMALRPAPETVYRRAGA